mmetsp:Transcript_18501/g.40031  ORF Transcript_18501/g.40031 Transcript_18501/m.40031 type:complete len:141 (+) Transcript_18501:381-803(+)
MWCLSFSPTKETPTVAFEHKLLPFTKKTKVLNNDLITTMNDNIGIVKINAAKLCRIARSNLKLLHTRINMRAQYHPLISISHGKKKRHHILHHGINSTTDSAYLSELNIVNICPYLMTFITVAIASCLFINLHLPNCKLQ